MTVQISAIHGRAVSTPPGSGNTEEEGMERM